MKEIIFGIIVSKTNHYISVPDCKTGSRIVLDEIYRRYKASFLEQIKIYRNRLINAPFILIADVYYISDRFDLDNSIKTLLDLLQDARAITNDKLCIELHGRKHIDRRNPRVEFSIVEKEPTLF